MLVKVPSLPPPPPFPSLSCTMLMTSPFVSPLASSYRPELRPPTAPASLPEDRTVFVEMLFFNSVSFLVLHPSFVLLIILVNNAKFRSTHTSVVSYSSLPFCVALIIFYPTLSILKLFTYYEDRQHGCQC